MGEGFFLNPSLPAFLLAPTVNTTIRADSYFGPTCGRGVREHPPRLIRSAKPNPAPDDATKADLNRVPFLRCHPYPRTAPS